MRSNMKEQLLSLVNELKSDSRLASFDEAATKQIVLLRVLSLLGWNVYNIDEVKPEYSVGGQKVDYALRHSNTNKVFIEVKKVGEDLEKHREQLLNYSFKEGVKLSVLTGGISWWFYLPLHEGSWEQRKFYTIEIYDQETEEIVDRLIDYLGKENVCSGKAVQNAESVYKSKQRQYAMIDALPEAWNKIITEPDELLIDLIADETEKICGYKPDNLIVEGFISSHIGKAQVPTTALSRETPVSGKPTFGKLANYTSKSVIAFSFKNTRYEVIYWIDVLIKVCNLMHSLHQKNYEWILQLRGRKKPYFTKNLHELRVPQQIEGTDIFMETNLSANQIVKTCLIVISLFGYSEKDFGVELR